MYSLPLNRNTAYKGKFQFIASDFLEVEKVEKFSQDVLALYPDGVDILVNNAGIYTGLTECVYFEMLVSTNPW